MRIVTYTVAVALGALVLAGSSASDANADVGIVSLSRSEARPGETVKIKIACGFCEAGAEFPLSMVPFGRHPEYYPCGNNALCAPAARKPPGEYSYSFLGETETVAGPPTKFGSVGAWSVLRFRVPKVDPGRYVLVIFCADCLSGPKGPKGTLITSPNEPRGRLQVLPVAHASPTPVSGDSGDGGIGTWVWPAGVLVLTLGFGLAFWRRRHLDPESR